MKPRRNPFFSLFCLILMLFLPKCSKKPPLSLVDKSGSLHGRSGETRTPGVLFPNGGGNAFPLGNSRFRRVLFRKKCSPALMFPLSPPVPVPVMVGDVVINKTAPENRLSRRPGAVVW